MTMGKQCQNLQSRLWRKDRKLREGACKTHRHRKQSCGYQRGKVGRDKIGVWD